MPGEVCFSVPQQDAASNTCTHAHTNTHARTKLGTSLAFRGRYEAWDSIGQYVILGPELKHIHTFTHRQIHTHRIRHSPTSTHTDTYVHTITQRHTGRYTKVHHF